MLLATHGTQPKSQTGGGSFVNTKSIDLDGVDDRVNMGNSSSLNFDNTDAFSFSFWVKRTSFNTADVVLSKCNSFGNQRGYFININANDQLVIQLRNNVTNNNFRLNVRSTSLINTSNWYHIVVTYDGTSTVNSFKMYFNGQSDTVTNKIGTLSGTIQNTANFIIGDYKNSFPTHAILDEISVYDYELLASDVTSIYGTGVPNDISSFNPLSHWRCGDGDTSPILTDNGSGGNDGTMQNFSTFSNNVP